MEKLLETFLEHFRGAWRFRLYTVVSAWLLCVLGWFVVYSLPDLYQSSARIFVDTKTALGSVLQGLTIQQDVNSQLGLVRQSLLSRPQLEKFMLASGIAKPDDPAGTRAALVDAVAKRVELTAQDSGNGGITFSIKYEDPSRDASLKMVTEMTRMFVEETLGGKREGSEVAQQFLERQISEYERRLREAEDRLADFKRRNVGLMPGAQGDYFARLQAEQQAQEKARAELSIALSGREELARQLRGESSAATADPGKDALVDTGETTLKIRETETRLDQLLLQYTDKHPDVIAARSTLNQLKLRQAEEVAQLRKGVGGLAGGAAASPVLQSIQLALNKADLEIAGLRARIGESDRRTFELKKLVNVAPEVEAEFARLNRDYDVTRERYTAFVDRAERTQVGNQADSTDTVRFDTIDPPTASRQPVSPNRVLLLAAVFIVALGAGGGLAVLMHLLNPVFGTRASLAEATGLPVLGVVTRTADPQRSQRKLRERFRFVASMACLVLAFGVVVVFNDAGSRVVGGIMKTRGP